MNDNHFNRSTLSYKESLNSLMCGITGVFSSSPSFDLNCVIRMRDTMVHRGPDDAGIWWSPDKRLVFAHRRLAIVDLSTAAHQPMVDSSGTYVIVFNGEIYNHQDLRKELIADGCTFRSNSDTEVLLECYKKWGGDFLRFIEGPFSFAIYDSIKMEIFLARDRAGEKPLFYYHSGQEFYFASELKALMAITNFPRKLDIDSLDYYLAYGYVPGDKCIIKNTNKLLPGHASVFSLKNYTLRIWRYWSLPDEKQSNNLTISDLTDQLTQLLSNAIQKQLVADVPVGILLSGGLDSSLITALAANVSHRRVKTFTISFPGHRAFDEGPYAKIVSDYFNTEHTDLIAEPASVALLPQLAHQFDEPIADHSIVPTSILAQLVRKSVTVALGGDGGDELFGGYPHNRFLQKIEQLRKWCPLSIRNSAAFVSKYLPLGIRGRNHMIGLRGGIENSISAINMFFDEKTRNNLLSPLRYIWPTPTKIAESRHLEYYNSSMNCLQNSLRTDFHTTLADDYLVKSDRASMLHSLELRAPFLNHELIEFAFRNLPDNLIATQYEGKILLRNLAKRLLPQTLDVKRKQGFTLPLTAWFKGEWGNYISDVLLGADASIFNKQVIYTLLSGQRLGHSNTERLFSLTIFELWRKAYNITI